MAQLETGANLTAELVVEWSQHATALPRLGNRDERLAPQGVYRCRADGPVPEWVAVTIADDAEWSVLATAMGAAELVAAHPTAADRAARHDEIDTRIAAWTETMEPVAVVDALRPHGIAVARVLSVPAQGTDPQLDARGFFVPLEHAKTGVRRYPGWPMQFSFAAAQHRFGAPTLGQHNREILATLGLTGEEIDELALEGVIGDRMQS